MTPQYGPLEVLDSISLVNNSLVSNDTLSLVNNQNTLFRYNSDYEQLYYQTLISSSSSSQGTVFPTRHSFYHNINNYIFEIICDEILETFEPMTSDTVTSKVFFFAYNSYNSTQHYKITCKVLSSSMVTYMLNKNVYSVDLNLNDQQQRQFVEFPEEIKVDFEFKLKPRLDEYLAQVPLQRGNANASCEYLNYEAEKVEANEKKESGRKWTKETTGSLLEILRNHLQELERGGSKPKKISPKHWQFVSDKLKVQTHYYSAYQCKIKFKNLKRKCLVIPSCSFKDQVQEILDMIEPSPRRTKKPRISEENATSK